MHYNDPRSNQNYPQQGYPAPTCPPQQGNGQFPYQQGVNQPQYPPSQPYPSQPGYPPQPQGAYSQNMTQNQQPGMNNYPPIYSSIPSYGAQQQPGASVYPENAPYYPNQQYAANPPSAYPPQTNYQVPNNAQSVQANSYYPPLQPGLTQNSQSHTAVYGEKNPKYVHVGPALPSLKPVLSSSPSADAVALFKAFKGFGCDSKMVINILTRRNCHQREQIKVEYMKSYGKDLIERSKTELYDPLERCICSLLYSGSDLDAYWLRKATKGVGTDETALREILCTRNSGQILKIKESYNRLYKKDLEKHIRSDTSGSFCKILITLLNQPRDQTTKTDMNMAQSDASQMLNRSSIRINAPVSLIPIFSERNYSQLLLTFQAYQNLTGKSIFNYIKSFMVSDYEKTLMMIYNFVMNPIHFYAKQLRDGITKKNIYQVIRVVSTRCEIDLGSILLDYDAMYHSKASDDIKKAFGSSHQETIEALFILIGQN